MGCVMPKEQGIATKEAMSRATQGAECSQKKRSPGSELRGVLILGTPCSEGIR
jgi:hypothetical protein